MGDEEELETGLELDPEDFGDFLEKIGEAFQRGGRFAYDSVGIDFSHVIYFSTLEEP